VLALLRSNTTFQLTSIKLFYEGNIKINDEPECEDPELHDEGEGDMGMIPPAILAIPPKRGRG